MILNENQFSVNDPILRDYFQFILIDHETSSRLINLQGQL